MLQTVPFAGSEIVALLTFGQFTARTLPVSGLSTAWGGASPLTLHTVSWPSPGAFPLIASHPLQCRAVGAHDPGQIEPYLEPSRDEALLGRIARMMCGSRCLSPGSLIPMMGEAGVARQARGWLPGVLARSPAALRCRASGLDGGDGGNLTWASGSLGWFQRGRSLGCRSLHLLNPVPEAPTSRNRNPKVAGHGPLSNRGPWHVWGLRFRGNLLGWAGPQSSEPRHDSRCNKDTASYSPTTHFFMVRLAPIDDLIHTFPQLRDLRALAWTKSCHSSMRVSYERKD